MENLSTPGFHNSYQRVNSNTLLLSSPPADYRGAPPGYRPVAEPSEVPFTPTPPSRLTLYQKYWKPHYNMFFLLIVGVLFAVGHHIFYLSLDGKEATNQMRLLRYGAALSFLSKASLAAATVTAYRQRVWMTVRRKVLTVAAVDGLFAATEDLTALLNFELFKEAKLAMILVIYVWCTPLIVIFASETLAVQPQTLTEETACPSIRSLNFAHEENNDWRVAHYIDGVPEASVSYWNITTEDKTSPDLFDYWAQPSQQVEQVATLAAFLKGPVAKDNVAAEVCGVGWNCTFTVNFIAPGYKCTELANGVGSTPKKLGDAIAPFSTDILAPTGNFTYFASAYEGEYADPQMDSGDSGVPLSPPPFPKNLGVFRTEPVLWIGYASVEDPTKKQPNERSDANWDTAFTPKIFGCEHYETEYEVEFNYVSLQQDVKIKNRKYLNPIIDTVFQRGELVDDGTRDNTTAIPEANYIRPTDDLGRYRRIAAYHSLGSQLRRFINGTIHEPNKILKSKVSQTRLIDIHSYLAAGDLMADIPTFYEDIVLSLFSNPQFLAVVWAADPETPSGRIEGGEETLYPCIRHRTSNHYVYHVADLWAVYTIAIFLAVVGTAFGMMAIWEEGVSRDTRFSSVAAATRGSALEKIPFGPEGELRTRAKRVKIGYGVVDRGHYGFGVEGEVLQSAGNRKSTQTFRFG